MTKDRDVNYRNRRGGPAKGPSIVLGLASAGLGALALTQPRTVARIVGVREDATTELTLRLAGARELLPAAGLLARRRPRRWLWFRVIGDALDVALLTQAMRTRRADNRRTAIAIGVLGGIAAFDLAAALRARRAGELSGGDHAIRARAAITVNRPQQQVYAFWRELENLPGFMAHVEQVTADGDGRSHWKVRGPARTHVEWDAEVIAEHPGALIAWASLPGATVTNRGSVRFRPAPGDRGTEVMVDLMYEPPAGAAGSLIARILGEEPVQQLKDDLRRFKQILEAGEIATSATGRR
jgi:uncharacterized membrane protein